MSQNISIPRSCRRLTSAIASSNLKHGVPIDAASLFACMLPRASVSPHARRAFSQSIVFRDNAKKPEQQTKNAAGKPQKAPGRKIPSPMSAIAKTIKEYASKTTDQYVTYGVTEKLFATCSAQAEYTIPQASRGEEAMKLPSGEDLGVGTGWWYEELGLAPTFSTWSQVTFLHMYLLTVRLRAMPSHDSFLNYSRHLFDHFSHDAERRMDVLHQITLRGARNNYLKDLHIQWRGVLAAYDEGLVSGDAVLGAAVWRNLWKGSAHNDQGEREEFDWTKVARVVAYMRRTLREMSRLSEGEVVSNVASMGGLPGEVPLFRREKSDIALVNIPRAQPKVQPAPPRR